MPQDKGDNKSGEHANHELVGFCLGFSEDFWVVFLWLVEGAEPADLLGDELYSCEIDDWVASQTSQFFRE